MNVGTKVKHANPELADWRGTVTETRDDEYMRFNWIQHIPTELDALNRGYATYVHVTWTEGTVSHNRKNPGSGWFSIDAIEPIE